MDVDSFGRGGKKGKEEGHERKGRNQNSSKDVHGWHCGNKGLLSTGCWSGIQKGKQGAGSLEQGEQAAKVELQQQLAFASSLDLASTETRRHWCGDFSISAGCKDWHGNAGD